MIAMSILSLALVSTLPGPGITRTINHSSGSVTADYRGAVVIERKQIGSVAPPGRPSTLRCQWTAHLNVERQAAGAGGLAMSRSFVRPNVAEGSRPGWCEGHSPFIDREVAERMQDQTHLQQAADEDRATLMIDVDRLVESRR